MVTFRFFVRYRRSRITDSGEVEWGAGSLGYSVIRSGLKHFIYHTLTIREHEPGNYLCRMERAEPITNNDKHKQTGPGQ